MLVKITESALSDADKINAAILRDWQAVDLETAAHLFRTRGRAKYGNPPRYHLILPHNGNLFKPGFEIERTAFRAETLERAIEMANEKLPKLLKQKAKRLAAVQPDCDHPFRVTGDVCLNCGEMDTVAE